MSGVDETTVGLRGSWYICYNCHMTQHMTRIEVSEAMWRRFRSIAVERGLTTPELLGSVVSGYVVRAERRRRTIRIEN